MAMCACVARARVRLRLRVCACACVQSLCVCVPEVSPDPIAPVRCPVRCLVRAHSLWKDDLDPHSLAQLRVRVLVTARFWVASIRCFVRVNGVRARVLETRFVCHHDRPDRVTRESSWREGDWRTFAGPDAAAHIDFDAMGEHAAVARLPHRHPPRTQSLTLPHAPQVAPQTASLAAARIAPQPDLQASPCPAIGLDAPFDLGAAADEACEGWRHRWVEAVRADALVAHLGVPGAVHCVCDGGTACVALDVATGRELWRRTRADFDGAVVAAALAPSAADGGRLAIGTEHARVLIWRGSTGESLVCCALRPSRAVGLPACGLAALPSCHVPSQPSATTAAAVARHSAAVGDWVEQLVWSSDGTRLGFAAGRGVAIANVEDGTLVACDEAPATVYALHFLPTHAGARDDGKGHCSQADAFPCSLAAMTIAGGGAMGVRSCQGADGGNHSPEAGMHLCIAATPGALSPSERMVASVSCTMSRWRLPLP